MTLPPRIRLLASAFIPVALIALAGISRCQAQQQQPTVKSPTAQANALPGVQNTRAETPSVADPVPFTSKEGKKGWRVTIPGERPLATPAVVDGKVFIGGGFGSYEFYAFDARTGKQAWLYRTSDDGPTAAAVADGCIAFNTESCELEVITVAGKAVWKKWLGDPLMSMPAISKSKVYMAYPDDKDAKNYLACFDLKTGAEQWKKPIAAEIITAPVIEQDKIYAATIEGTVSCFRESDGQLVWTEKKNATSSPTVWNGQCYFSCRIATVQDKDGKQVEQQNERLVKREIKPQSAVKELNETTRLADYLDHNKRQQNSTNYKLNTYNDAAVGFGGGAPKGAQLNYAMSNLGQGTVADVWSYQGSRPFAYRNRLYTAMGDTLSCVDVRTDKVLWKKDLKRGKDKELLVDAAVTPPAIVNGKVFACAHDRVLCLSAESGEVLWTATVGEQIMFQPAVAEGRVFVSTVRGSLFCFETGDSKDDGWRMWGGNAQHNGLAESELSTR